MDTTKIEIVKTDRKNDNTWSEKYIREILIDGELVGTFNPANSDWYILDLAGEHVHITERTSITGRIGVEFEGRWIGYATRARSIADMEFIVLACLELDRIPDQAGIEARKVERDVAQAKEDAEMAEYERVDLIEQHAVEMLEVLEKIATDNLHMLPAGLFAEANKVIDAARGTAKKTAA